MGIFDTAAVLAPWYFTEQSPLLTRNGRKLSWRYVEKAGGEYAGVFVLSDRNESCLGMVKIYTYLLPVGDGSRFLVWVRNGSGPSSEKRVRVDVFDTASLMCAGDLEQELTAFVRRKDPYYFPAMPVATLYSEIDPRGERQILDYPAAMSGIDEFLMVREIPGLYDNPKPRWYDTALLVFRPRDSFLEIYPQDWFNKDERMDFDYQWITRVARNPRNGRIQGDGIRLDPFTLDKTNRMLRRNFFSLPWLNICLP